MSEFENKSILIVGGSSGIGLSLAKGIRERGGSVHVWSRHETPELRELGIHHETVDVTKPLAEVPASMPETLHGLVYLPGSIRLAPIQRLEESDFQEDFEVNVLGAVRVIKACFRSLARGGRGDGAAIVLVSTVASHVGMSFHASVAAAKSAVQGMAASLAAELASRRIRVNVVSPSITDTPLAAHLLDSDEKRERSAKRHPLGRIGRPEDIAGAIRFLLSPEASWITGQAIPVDGGLAELRPI
jgi:NAD(P)-dependent dehydrogenase (short-subunit alcohol dehydrogenase family)